MEKYILDALRTDLPDYGPVIQRFSDPKTARLLHAIMGLVTESGELMDQLKKHLMYGKPIDLINLKEEGGDSFWYLAILADELGHSFGEIMDSNIKKLKARYPHKFTEESALERDLNKERQILESDNK